MKRKKILMIILLFSFAEFFYGCCGNQYRKPDKEIEVERTAPPPLMVWNESKYNIEFFLVRGDGGAIKQFMVPKEKKYLLPLSQEGGYRYYFKAYDKNENFFGERMGVFNITTGKLKNYKNKLAGFHIVIKDENIKYRKSASRELFGDENFVGEIKYGKRQDEMNLSNSGSRANIRFSGLPALLFEFFTQKNE